MVIRTARSCALAGALGALGCSSQAVDQEASPEPPPLVEPLGDPVVEPCEAQLPAPVQTGRLSLPVNITVAATPASVTAEVAAPSGRAYAPSFFAFYVSQPTLFDASGRTSMATLLAPDGSAQPYDVHVVDLRKPDTLVLRLAAPPGRYAGLRFSVGMPEPCRSLDPHQQVYPLSSDSDMTWDWAGYLHLRLEGQVRESGTFQPQFMLHHMFQAESFTSVIVRGWIDVGTEAEVVPGLWLDIDRMLAPTTAASPMSEHGFDGWLMDNLAEHGAFELR